METMTEEEAFALDEYLCEKAKTSHEKPEEILSSLVREKLAVGV